MRIKRTKRNKKEQKGGKTESKRYLGVGIYYGNIVDGKRSGNGKMLYFKDISTYIGKWKDDKRNGRGILFSVEEKVLQKGIWVNDELYESDIYKHQDIIPKKTITILINAHGADLLTESTVYHRLYPNKDIKADVRILNLAGNTCSLGVTDFAKGNKTVSVANNISRIFKLSKDTIPTFELINQYIMNPIRYKYATSIVQGQTPATIVEFEKANNLHKNSYKRTVETSENFENFSFFTPIFDHLYSFVDHNSALQATGGIFVLNVRNFSDSPFLETVLLNGRQKFTFFTIFRKWIDDITPTPTPLTVFKIQSEPIDHVVIDSGIWETILDENSITTVDQLIEFFKQTDIKYSFNRNIFIKAAINDATLLEKHRLNVQFDQKILNKLNIATRKYFEQNDEFSDLVLLWLKKITGIRDKNRQKMADEVKAKNITTFDEFYQRLLAKSLRFEDEDDEEDLEQVLTEQTRENIEQEFTELPLRAITLTKIVDTLYKFYGFEVINIVDLSCRYYSFHNWTKEGISYKPTEEEEDVFVEEVKLLEDKNKRYIDPRYGGKNKKTRKNHP